MAKKLIKTVSILFTFIHFLITCFLESVGWRYLALEQLGTTIRSKIDNRKKEKTYPPAETVANLAIQRNVLLS